MSSKCFFYELAYAEMYSVDRSFANAKLYVNQSISFIIILRESNGGVCRGGQDRVDADLMNITGKTTKGGVQYLSQGRMKVILTAERRGQHQLNLKVNGAHIKNSPFTVTVFMPPNRLLQPIATISGLDQPYGLKCCRDKVLATEIKKGRIIEIDSHFNVKEFNQLSGATELTPDSDLNIYVSTSDHQVHKVSKDGRIIKTVGQLGKRNAEFNFPNGLRVSKNRELYICDSDNNRVQVFDLDLNFKRSFGKKGTGKGQFNFPADVNFDLSCNIYVTDNRNHRIQVFTAYNERHICTIGDQALQPVSLFMHGDHVYVTDELNHQVMVMNTLGEVVTKFGSGYLNSPEGITIDKDGFVLRLLCFRIPLTFFL